MSNHPCKVCSGDGCTECNAWGYTLRCAGCLGKGLTIKPAGNSRLLTPCAKCAGKGYLAQRGIRPEHRPPVTLTDPDECNTFEDGRRAIAALAGAGFHVAARQLLDHLGEAGDHGEARGVIALYTRPI
jgi:hypothetical protein